MHSPGALPQYANARAFHDEQFIPFRPGPPPALDSPQYAADVNEVKAIAVSIVRSALRRKLSSHSSAAILRSMKTRWPARWCRAATRWPDTRPFFAFNQLPGMRRNDAGFDAKYHYGFWRPFTRFG